MANEESNIPEVAALFAAIAASAERTLEALLIVGREQGIAEDVLRAAIESGRRDGRRQLVEMARASLTPEQLRLLELHPYVTAA